ncbi:unnamed protein product [Withania somnifera]
MSDKEFPVSNNWMEVDEEGQRVLSWDKLELYKWEGFWSNPTIVKATINFQATFKSDPNDVLLASSIKTGTTWLMAICVCIMQGYKEDEDQLAKGNPHFHVPTVEAINYYKTLAHDVYTMSSPRLFHTHLPYRVLPDSIKNSNHCKILYITRNPKDTLISMWHFFNNNRNRFFPLEEAVESFCNGIHAFGPFFEHVKKIALFLGKPFDNEEDVEMVLNKCSLERLKNLEVNKSGSTFYVVGDWKNHLTPEMVKRLDNITILKLQGSGLEL